MTFFKPFGTTVLATVDMVVPLQLSGLYKQWRNAVNMGSKAKIWNDMQDLYTSEVYVIGLVAGVLQPVVTNSRLQNIPDEGYYNWDPGAHFGCYRPDTFWLESK